MRKFKTGKTYRNMYTYYFLDGKKQRIEVNDEVSEKDIALLHQLDDEEIDRERRHKYLVPSYLEEFSINDDLPTNPLLVDLRTPSEILKNFEKKEQKEKMIQALFEAIKTLTPKQRKTVEAIFYEGLNNSQLARKEGVSEMAIRCRLKVIYKKLEKNILKIIEKRLRICKIFRL
jgi:RNA polymerase sigma factor (sigma-70 family)